MNSEKSQMIFIDFFKKLNQNYFVQYGRKAVYLLKNNVIDRDYKKSRSEQRLVWNRCRTWICRCWASCSCKASY